MLRRRCRREDIDRSLDARSQGEWTMVELDLAGLDLREIEDVVDDRQQRIARCADRLGVVALLVIERRVEQQAAHPDDRVHRRADLVAHRGEERALGAVGVLGRFAGCLALAEQAGIVDGDRGLLGHAHEQLEVVFRELPARHGPPGGEHAHDLVTGDQRSDHQPLLDVGVGARDLHAAAVGLDVVDDLGIAAQHDVADDPLADPDRVVEDGFGECADRDDRLECLAIGLGQEQGGRIDAEQRLRKFHDLLQDRRQVQVRGDLATDLGERRHLARPPARLLVQPCVRDRGPDVRGERREQSDVFIAEAALLRGALDADDADRFLALEDRHAQVGHRLGPDPAVAEGLPLRGVAQQERRPLSHDPRREAGAEGEGRLVLGAAVLGVVRELDLSGFRIQQRDVDDVRRERLAHLLAHEFDQGVEVELGAQRLADAVDDRELGRLPPRLPEQPRILERDAEARGDAWSAVGTSASENAFVRSRFWRLDAVRARHRRP